MPERAYHKAMMLSFILLCFPTGSAGQEAAGVETMLGKMKAAASSLMNYRAHVEVRTYQRNGSADVKEFLYSFMKPRHIRIDFISPHPGMVMVYPDDEGKVAIRPWRWAAFLKFSAAPDSHFLKDASGQRIDQTHLPLLVENINRSVHEDRRGPVEISEEGRIVRIHVLAENHFRKGTTTLYTFHIDNRLWLPVSIKEATPEGFIERRVILKDLRINTDLQNGLFDLNGG